MNEFVVGSVVFPPVVYGARAMLPVQQTDIDDIHALCKRLSSAAEKLGPTDEGMACIGAQHKLMALLRERMIP